MGFFVFAYIVGGFYVMVTYEEAKDRLRRRFSCLGRRRGRVP